MGIAVQFLYEYRMAVQMGAIAPTLTLYYISRPPLSQNPPSAPAYVWLRLPGLFFFGLHWGPVETSNAKLGDFVYEDFPILLRIPAKKKKMTAHGHTLFLFFVVFFPLLAAINLWKYSHSSCQIKKKKKKKEKIHVPAESWTRIDGIVSRQLDH